MKNNTKNVIRFQKSRSVAKRKIIKLFVPLIPIPSALA
jgi:hypothetical protein